MRISKKLIAQNCLPIYKELLEKGKKDNKYQFLKRLRKNNALYGICSLYNSLPNNVGNIYSFKFINKIKKVNSCGKVSKFLNCWYTQIPITCNTKREIINCINKRINLLESWL